MTENSSCVAAGLMAESQKRNYLRDFILLIPVMRNHICVKVAVAYCRGFLYTETVPGG